MLTKRKSGTRLSIAIYTAVLIFPISVLIFGIASAEPIQNSSNATLNHEDSLSQRLNHIGFEYFENGLPAGMDSTLGAITGDSLIANVIEQDSSVFLSGHSSLRITGSDSTCHWYLVKVDMPDDLQCVTASLYAKGNGLHQEGNQYGNCGDAGNRDGSKRHFIPLHCSEQPILADARV